MTGLGIPDPVQVHILNFRFKFFQMFTQYPFNLNRKLCFLKNLAVYGSKKPFFFFHFLPESFCGRNGLFSKKKYFTRFVIKLLEKS